MQQTSDMQSVGTGTQSATIPTCAAADIPAKAPASSRLRMATMMLGGQQLAVQAVSLEGSLMEENDT